MHITADMFEAVARGEMSPEELHEIMFEHLAELCPGCAEVVAAHEARLARGEDAVFSRKAFEWDFVVHVLAWRERTCDHHTDHGPS
jgi:hypothetical protein